MKKITEGINFAYPTPITLTTIGSHQFDSAEILSILNEDQDLERKSMVYKNETPNRFHNNQHQEVQKLCQIVCDASQLMIESIKGVHLDDAIKIQKEIYQKEYNSPLEKGSSASILITDSWCSVYNVGDFHPPHNHPSVDVVAVYYLTDPIDEDTGGEIAFIDPRSNVNYHRSAIPFCEEGMSFSYSPSRGDLLLFPGWLNHYVLPIKKGQRISISFNISILYS